jgi:hypothetical protein
VDVDNKVGTESIEVGRQETEVIPASCPMSNASNVTENHCELKNSINLVAFFFKKKGK